MTQTFPRTMTQPANKLIPPGDTFTRLGPGPVNNYNHLSIFPIGPKKDVLICPWLEITAIADANE